MYAVIDHFDSFVYNLVVYIREIGKKTEVIRSDQVSVKELLKEGDKGGLEGIILSPGPGPPGGLQKIRGTGAKAGRKSSASGRMSGSSDHWPCLWGRSFPGRTAHAR